MRWQMFGVGLDGKTTYDKATAGRERVRKEQMERRVIRERDMSMVRDRGRTGRGRGKE